MSLVSRSDLHYALLEAATDPSGPESLARRFISELGERLHLTGAAVWAQRDGAGPPRLVARWPLGDTRPILPDPSGLPRKSTSRLVLLPGGLDDLAFLLPPSAALWMRPERAGDARVFAEDPELSAILRRFGTELDKAWMLRRTLRSLDDTSSAQRALRETASRLEALVESLDGGILVETEGGQIALANQAFCRLFAVPARAQNLIGADSVVATRGAGALFEDPSGFVAGVELALAAKERIAGQELAMVDGRILERDYMPIIGESGYSGHVWHYRDVSARRRAELEIARLKQFYEHVLESMPIQLAVLDAEGHYVHVTASAAPDAETRRWLIGRTDFELCARQGLPQRVAEERFAQLSEVVATGRLATSEESYRDRGGQMRQFLRFAHPVRGEDGQVIQVLRYRLETTERRQAEAALAASQARQAGVLAAAPDGVITFDQEGRVVAANPAAERIFGLTTSQLEGRTMGELIVADEAQAGAEGGLGMHLVSSRPDLLGRRVQLTGQRANGGRFPAELQVQPIGFDDGSFEFTAYVRDVTAEREAEESLRSARRSAEVSARAKEQFLANMSHEIRTPLNAVIGMTHLLAGTRLDGEQNRFLDGIRFSADTLLALLNGILDLSKIDSGKLVFESIAFDLDELLRGLVEANRAEAARRGLVLGLARSPEVPSRLVGDPLRLKQILLNLVGNALKFTERGGVEVAVELVGTAEDGRPWLAFAITDTGVGIASEKLGAVFEAFTQERAETGRRYGGTGLGLTIVRELVERQGGTVDVQSTLGRGSCFTIQLSFGVASGRPLASDATPESASGIAGARILLVEDNELNQIVASQLLRRIGAEVDIASDGAEALERLRAASYDVVLMDIQMPNMDGYEATRRIRGELGLAREVLPVIALTASVLLEQRSRAIEAGMDDFVMKPFHPRQLEEVIAGHLARRRGATLADAGERAVDERPAIDLEVLEAQTERQRDLALEILDLFVRQAPELGREMTTALFEQRLPQVAAIAHKLRSSAGVVGAARLRETLIRIERAIKLGAPPAEVGSELGTAGWEIAEAVSALVAARSRYA
jgi:PAS domain S-box-containing protein